MIAAPIGFLHNGPAREPWLFVLKPLLRNCRADRTEATALFRWPVKVFASRACDIGHAINPFGSANRLRAARELVTLSAIRASDLALRARQTFSGTGCG